MFILKDNSMVCTCLIKKRIIIFGQLRKKKKEAYNKANAARKAAKATKDATGGNNTKASGQKSPFKISDKLKAALCTEGQMSPDQFDRVCQNCEDF